MSERAFSRTFPQAEWETARPADVGMDAEKVAQAQQLVRRRPG